MADSWDQSRQYVLHQLKSNAADIETLDQKVNDLIIEQATQGVKYGIWGAIGSSVPVIAYFIIKTYLEKG